MAKHSKNNKKKDCDKRNKMSLSRSGRGLMKTVQKYKWQIFFVLVVLIIILFCCMDDTPANAENRGDVRREVPRGETRTMSAVLPAATPKIEKPLETIPAMMEERSASIAAVKDALDSSTSASDVPANKDPLAALNTSPNGATTTMKGGFFGMRGGGSRSSSKSTGYNAAKELKVGGEFDRIARMWGF